MTWSSAVGVGAGGDLGRRAWLDGAEGLVEPEAVAEVDAGDVERGERGAEDALGELAGSLGASGGRDDHGHGDQVRGSASRDRPGERPACVVAVLGSANSSR
jgi:hypothetical protein